jgi:hypothetical protein
VVGHENRLYQVERQSRRYAPAKSKVTVCEREDGRKEIYHRGRKLIWHESEERVAKTGSGRKQAAQGIHAASSQHARSPAAQAIPGHETAVRSVGRRGGRADFHGLGLRFALSARPKASQGSATAEATEIRLVRGEQTTGTFLKTLTTFLGSSGESVGNWTGSQRWD